MVPSRGVTKWQTGFSLFSTSVGREKKNQSHTQLKTQFHIFLFTKTDISKMIWDLIIQTDCSQSASCWQGEQVNTYLSTSRFVFFTLMRAAIDHLACTADKLFLLQQVAKIVPIFFSSRSLSNVFTYVCCRVSPAPVIPPCWLAFSIMVE